MLRRRDTDDGRCKDRSLWNFCSTGETFLKLLLYELLRIEVLKFYGSSHLPLWKV